MVKLILMSYSTDTPNRLPINEIPMLELLTDKECATNPLWVGEVSGRLIDMVLTGNLFALAEVQDVYRANYDEVDSRFETILEVVRVLGTKTY